MRSLAYRLDDATGTNVKAELQKMEEELTKAQEQIFDLSLELIDLKAQLDREQLINKIAFSYIPEDQHDEYYLQLPHRQCL